MDKLAPCSDILSNLFDPIFLSSFPSHDSDSRFPYFFIAFDTIFFTSLQNNYRMDRFFFNVRTVMMVVEENESYEVQCKPCFMGTKE